MTKHLPVEQNSRPVGQRQEHGTPIRRLLGQRSMRVLGQAFDRGIIKEGKK